MKQILRPSYRLDTPQELILVRILVTMGAATIVATFSLYLRSLGMSNSQIGIVTSVVMSINLLFALSIPAILNRFNLEKILFWTILCFAFILMLFGNSSIAMVALIFYILARLLLSLFYSAYSILFHDESPNPIMYKKNQALNGSLVNFSWMIVPFFSTLIISQYSFSTLYMIGAIVSLIALTILLVQKVPEKHKKRTKQNTSIHKNIKLYFSLKRLRDIYLISLGVNVWWAFIFVFVTLYLKEAGYSTAFIGGFLTLSQTPLFLLEFKMYKVVEKFKYRIPLVFCYSYMALMLLSTSIFGLNIVTMGLLLSGSFCLAFIEPAREMYLYEKLKLSDEEKFQPVYATAEIVGNMFIRLSIGLILVVFAASASFIFMACFMALLAWLSYRTEE